MEKYNFHQDLKVEVWQRMQFSVEAASLDEAKEKVKQMIIMPDGCSHADISSEIEVDSCEWLDETESRLYAEDNDGQPTSEVYSDEDDWKLTEKAGVPSADSFFRRLESLGSEIIKAIEQIIDGAGGCVDSDEDGCFNGESLTLDPEDSNGYRDTAHVIWFNYNEQGYRVKTDIGDYDLEEDFMLDDLYEIYRVLTAK